MNAAGAAPPGSAHTSVPRVLQSPTTFPGCTTTVAPGASTLPSGGDDDEGQPAARSFIT